MQKEPEVNRINITRPYPIRHPIAVPGSAECKKPLRQKIDKRKRINPSAVNEIILNILIV